MSDIDTIEPINGTPGCAECGSLLCVQKKTDSQVSLDREGDDPLVGPVLIAVATQPEPYIDIGEIQCAGCGKVLWRR